MLANRNEIPYNQSGIILNIPDIESSQFGNIKIYKYIDKSQPLVNFKINFKNGAAADSIPGQANYTLTMLLSGTKTKNASEISEQFESLGASYFFNAYWDESAIGFSSLGQYFETCLATLADCILNPAFEDSEIERQRDRISAGILQNNADPAYIAQVAFNKNMFKNHNYGHARTGNLGELAQITKKDILDFYELLMTKTEISIIITGNFDEQLFEKLIDKYFSVFKANIGIDSIPKFNYSKSLNVISGKDDALQTNLRIGKPSIDRLNPDYAAFQIVNTIFGGYFLSKLNHVLREIKGLTYGIHSYIDSRRFADIFVISTSINSDKTRESIQDIFDISLGMSVDKINEQEIARSVEFMTGSFARSLETPKQITGLIQTLDSFNLDKSFLTDFYSKIRNFSPDDIFEIQKKYFSDSEYLIAAAGDVDFLSEAIKDFGNYEIIEI